MQPCFVTTNNMPIHGTIMHRSQEATEENERNPSATLRSSKSLNSYMVANSASRYYVYGPSDHTPDCSLTCQRFPWKFLLRCTQFHSTFLPLISSVLFYSPLRPRLITYYEILHQLASTCQVRQHQEIFGEIYSSI
jgi:hypothetical protein